jgi:site-specific recombinase XerD
MDLKHQALAMMGKNRRDATLTAYKNRGQVARFCDVVQFLYGLERLQNLKQKHVVGALAHLRGQGLGSSTMASYATAARKIAQTIGKQNIVPRSNRDLEISRRGDRLKPVSANLLNISALTRQLHQEATWLGLASEMRSAFGLRAKESLLSHQVEDGALVVRGAKGGRPRSVPIRTQEQRDLLQKVHDYIQGQGQSSLIPSYMSLKQGLKYQTNAIYNLGGTKANGAHAHAQRHEYAQQLAAQGVSREQISAELGHGREEVVSHYVPR